MQMNAARICRESFLALFATFFHFQRHFDLFSLRDGLSCRATNLIPSIRAHRQLHYHARAARNDLSKPLPIWNFGQKFFRITATSVISSEA